MLCCFRWPPLSYITAMEDYREKYGGDEDDAEENETGAHRKRSRTKNEKCSLM